MYTYASFVAFELYEAKNAETAEAKQFVRIIFNDKVLSPPFCGKQGQQAGVCPYEAFAQHFASYCPLEGFNQLCFGSNTAAVGSATGEDEAYLRKAVRNSFFHAQKLMDRGEQWWVPPLTLQDRRPSPELQALETCLVNATSSFDSVASRSAATEINL